MYDPDAPTVGETYRYAWSVLWDRFPELLLAALAWIACSVPSSILHRQHANAAAILYDTLVMVPLNFGAFGIYVRAIRGEAFQVGDLFRVFRSGYAQTILAHVLFIVIVGTGIVLGVLPGLWLGSRLAFVGYLVIDEHADAMDAIRESWELTRGFAGRIFVLFLLGLLIACGGILLFGVGLVPAVMWANLAFAAFFVAVRASAPIGGTIPAATTADA